MNARNFLNLYRLLFNRSFTCIALKVYFTWQASNKMLFIARTLISGFFNLLVRCTLVVIAQFISRNVGLPKVK